MQRSGFVCCMVACFWLKSQRLRIAGPSDVAFNETGGSALVATPTVDLRCACGLQWFGSFLHVFATVSHISQRSRMARNSLANILAIVSHGSQQSRMARNSLANILAIVSHGSQQSRMARNSLAWLATVSHDSHRELRHRRMSFVEYGFALRIVGASRQRMPRGDAPTLGAMAASWGLEPGYLTKLTEKALSHLIVTARLLCG